MQIEMTVRKRSFRMGVEVEENVAIAEEIKDSRQMNGICADSFKLQVILRPDHLLFDNLQFLVKGEPAASSP